MKEMIRLGIWLLLSSALAANAQTLMSEDEAIRLALGRSPLLNASTLEVQRQRQLQGTSFNLANPDITLESPTGEFMTVGVLQSFEFPTVYVRQGQLAKQQTVLAEKGQVMAEADVKKRVREAYLNLQYAQALMEQLQRQDSVYQGIAMAAERLFAAGQIDKVAQTYTAAQYGTVHQRWMRAKTDAALAQLQLQRYTGKAEVLLTTPLGKGSATAVDAALSTDSSMLAATPLINYMRQQETVAQKTLQVERNRALPGFSFGYMNQGLAGTPAPLRLRGGINIPLWFWQYSASIKAAKTQVEQTAQNNLAQQQELGAQMEQARGELLNAQMSLDYYESSGLQQADELISASERMFAVGETDHLTYLRTLSDAYTIRMDHLETLRSLNLASITLTYLNGK
jgi:outer membrane protein, heavy metal efflux system